MSDDALDDDDMTTTPADGGDLGGDADGTDGDGTDGTDGDTSDSDGTDGGDSDGTDGGDADGTDGEAEDAAVPDHPAQLVGSDGFGEASQAIGVLT